MRATTARFSVATVKRYVWLLDPVTGLVIATSGLVQLWRDPPGGSFHGPTWANATWMVVLGAAVAIRRRAPLTALVAISLIEVPIQLAWYRHAPQPPFQPFPAILLVVYAVSLSVSETRRHTALALIVDGSAITDITAFVDGRALGDVIPEWVFVTLAWLFGRAVSKRQSLADTETERATQLERERDAASEVVAEAERARL